MRMWMVDPEIMCREHLLGEHRELHMITGTFNNHPNGHSVLKGLVSGGKLDLSKLVERHDELVEEMEQRGYDHKTPMDEGIGKDWGEVDEDKSLDDLLARCDECRERVRRIRA